MIGQTLDRYRIESKLGEGGMGVVYRARDTHLDRDVAIKILHQDKLSDPARRQRFVQEAKAASALNHSGIVTIHDIRSDAGVDFIVMEFVDGTTLDHAIPAKGLPVGQAARYAAEIADALAKAHEAGIVHRDLKPSNVMITEADHVKILDFGLAKLLDAREASNGTTVASPRTEEGMVLGTVAYMSPEQAEGFKVDARSDIFSLGAVLYELVTGRKPFVGDSSLKVLTKVLNEDPPPPSTLAASIPPDLDKLIARCLRKDPSRRYQTMADLKVALEDVGEESGTRSWPAAGFPVRSWMWPAVSAALLLVLMTLAWRVWRTPQASEPLRAVPLTTLQGVERHPSFSPDGERVAFSWNGPDQNNSDIYVQQIGLSTPVRLTTDSGNDYSPAWSPDGRWIAFLRGDNETSVNQLRLIPSLGGPERAVATTQSRLPSLRVLSIAWCPDSTCLIVSDSAGEGKEDALSVVSLESGEKRQLTRSQPGTHDADPAVSPDGAWLVFRRDRAPLTGELYRLRLGAGMAALDEPQRLTATELGANSPAWITGGKEIVFAARVGLWRLDVVARSAPTRLPFVGDDGLMPVVSRGQVQRLAYVRSYADLNIWRVDVTTPGTAASAPPVAAISSTQLDFLPDFAPDGKRVAFVSSRSGEQEIWTADPDGSNAVQVTAMSAVPGFPRWSPDGKWIAFHSNPEGQPEVYVVPSAGGKARNFSAHPAADNFPSFSSDGQSLYFNSTRGGQPEVWKAALSGGAAARVGKGAGSAVTESLDHADIYYVEAFNRPSALWRAPLSGAAPTKIADGVVSSNFAVVEGGIYYMDRPSAETRLQFFESRTGRSTTVASNLGAVALGMTATHDGRTILYTRRDASVDDLMLVENFR